MRSFFCALMLCLAWPAAAGDIAFPPQPSFLYASRDPEMQAKNFAQSPLSKMWNEPTLGPVKKAGRDAFVAMRALAEKTIPGVGEQGPALLTQLHEAIEALHDVGNVTVAGYLDIDGDIEGEALTVCIAVEVGGATRAHLMQAIFSDAPSPQPMPLIWKTVHEQIHQPSFRERYEKHVLAGGAIALMAADPKSPMTIGMSNDHLIISNKPEWARQALEGAPIAGGIDPVAEAFGAGNAALPVHALTVRTEHMWTLLDRAIAKTTPAPGEAAGANFKRLMTVRDTLQGLGLANLSSIVDSTEFRTDGFYTRFGADLKAEPSGLFGLSANEPFDLPNWVPDPVDYAAEMHYLPLSQLWELARAATFSLGGDRALKDWDAFVSRLNDSLGADIEKAFIGNFGGRMMAYASHGGTGGALPPLMAAIEVKDGPAAMDFLTRAVAKIGDKSVLIETSKDLGAGRYYRTIGAEALPGAQPAYGILDGRFVIASSGREFEAIAARRAAGGDAAGRALLSNAIAKAGFKAEGVRLSYMDLRQTVRQAPVFGSQLSTLLPLVLIGDPRNDPRPDRLRAIRALGSALNDFSDSLEKMDGEALARHLGPSVMVMRLEDGDFKGETLGVVPGLEVAPAMAAIAVGGVMLLAGVNDGDAPKSQDGPARNNQEATPSR